MKQAIIFSDNTGWHEEQLACAMDERGLENSVVPLTGCELGFEQNLNGVFVPGFEESLPDAVFVRAIPAGSFEEVTFRLDILHALKACGVVVYNDAASVERTVDKAMTSFLLSQRKIATPAVWVCESERQAREVINTQLAAGRRLVQKPLFGNCGRGLQLIATADTPLNAELINGVYYLQEYIDQDDHNGRDWRVFVVNHNAMAAMERVSEHWITNRARGGSCLPAVLTPELRELAEAASRATGIQYGGVDIIRDSQGSFLVLEVNSVPAWRGLQTVCSINLARLLVDDLVGRIGDSDRSAQHSGIA